MLEFVTLLAPVLKAKHWLAAYASDKVLFWLGQQVVPDRMGIVLFMGIRCDELEGSGHLPEKAAGPFVISGSNRTISPPPFTNEIMNPGKNREMFRSFRRTIYLPENPQGVCSVSFILPQKLSSAAPSPEHNSNYGDRDGQHEVLDITRKQLRDFSLCNSLWVVSHYKLGRLTENKIGVCLGWIQIEDQEVSGTANRMSVAFPSRFPKELQLMVVKVRIGGNLNNAFLSSETCVTPAPQASKKHYLVFSFTVRLCFVAFVIKHLKLTFEAPKRARELRKAKRSKGEGGMSNQVFSLIGLSSTQVTNSVLDPPNEANVCKLRGSSFDCQCIWELYKLDCNQFERIIINRPPSYRKDCRFLFAPLFHSQWSLTCLAMACKLAIMVNAWREADFESAMLLL